jgi:hypothetical protein
MYYPGFLYPQLPQAVHAEHAPEQALHALQALQALQVSIEDSSANLGADKFSNIEIPNPENGNLNGSKYSIFGSKSAVTTLSIINLHIPIFFRITQV